MGACCCIRTPEPIRSQNPSAHNSVRNADANQQQNIESTIGLGTINKAAEVDDSPGTREHKNTSSPTPTSKTMHFCDTEKVVLQYNELKSAALWAACDCKPFTPHKSHLVH